jgi:hypothetical protein
VNAGLNLLALSKSEIWEKRVSKKMFNTCQIGLQSVNINEISMRAEQAIQKISPPEPEEK